MMTTFRGYTSRRGWARAKWRALRRLPSQARSAARSWWWYWTGLADRLEREAREWRQTAALRFEQYRQARDLAYHLKYPPAGGGGALLLAADEVSLERPNNPCEHVWQEPDTGAGICEREQRGEICWCGVAAELRDLEKALREGEQFNRDSGRLPQGEDATAAECEASQSGLSDSEGIAKTTEPQP